MWAIIFRKGDKMLRKIRRIIRKIKNVISWFPVIWQDEQWDFYYFYRILNKKLDLIEKHMKSDFCMKSVNQDKYIKQVQVCKYLVERLIYHDYTENALIPYYKKYGKDCENKYITFVKNEEIPGFRTMVDSMPKKQKEMQNRLFRKSYKMKDIDKNMLFVLLSKYIYNFWD